MLTLEQLINLYPQHLWLEISPENQEKAWSQVQNYSNDVSRWNAYVNNLCLNTFINYLQEESDLQEESLLVQPKRQDLLSIWDVVNGSAIELGETRLILIPSEITDIDEFSVPFEWVDIPSFAGNYYLAIQLKLEDDECWMRVWGFTTHQNLKQGQKDDQRRFYTMERKDLIESLNVMWVGRKVCPEEKPVVVELPTLSSITAKKLLTELSQQNVYSPRLEVDFQQWAALLVDDNSRWELCKKRGYQLPQEKVATEAIAAQSQTIEKTIEQALKRVFITLKSNWQTIDEVLGITPQQFAVRSRNTQEEITDLEEAKKGFILAKPIEIKLPKITQQLALLVGLIPSNELEDIDVSVEIRSLEANQKLPSNLQLMVLDENNKTVMYAYSQENDPRISFKFGVDVGETFTIKLAIDNFIYTQVIPV